MKTAKYEAPTQSQRKEILDISGEKDRFVKENERLEITSISRCQAWQLERKGAFPQRVKLGSKSVAWLLSDLLWFIYRHTESPKNNKVSSQDI